MRAFWEAPAGLAAIGGILMAVDSYWSHIAACCVFGLSGLWALIGGLAWMKNVRQWTVGSYARASGTVIFVLGMFAAMWFGWPAAIKAQVPNINGNCNNNSGTFYSGNCGNTYNVEPQRLKLTDGIKSILLKNIPKEKQGSVTIIGPSEADWEAGLAIVKFLKSSGYKISGVSRIGMPMPMPSHPLTLDNPPNSSSWVLIIAPSAR